MRPTRKRKLPKFLLLLVLAGLFLTVMPIGARAQAQEERAASDTLAQRLSFEIRWLKLEMVWPQLFKKENYEELIELKVFAEEAAKQGDYSLALVYLDELFRSIGSEPATAEAGGDEPAVRTGPATTEWEKTAIWGMDFSRQEYHLTYGLADSAVLESYNNPFAGMRIRWNRRKLNVFDAELQAMAKASRDFLYGQGQASYERSRFLSGRFRIGQQFEAMKYRRYFSIQYQQSYTDLGYSATYGDRFGLELRTEWQYRHYSNENESFPTYWRTSYFFQGQVLDFLKGRLYADLQQEVRRHKTFRFYDFTDTRWDMTYYLSPSWKTNTSVWAQFRTMRYPHLENDSTYLADFDQSFVIANVRQRIQERISLRASVESVWRNYLGRTPYLKDYWHFRLQPGFLLELSQSWSLGLDYLLEIKKFEKSPIPAENWLVDQNFFSEGVVVTVDFMNFKNLLVSLMHTVRLNSYPDAPNVVIPGLSLYTDRFENSTMLYVSYQFFSSLSLNLILQHNLDRDREIRNNDAQSSIFSLDLGWKF